jgi:hypothetical protein
MTAVDPRGEKIELPRDMATSFWQEVQRHYAEDDSQKWKLLAMLALRENSGWTMEQIGYAIGHARGHVSRCIRQVKDDLQLRFKNAEQMRERCALDERDLILSEQELAAIQNEEMAAAEKPLRSRTTVAKPAVRRAEPARVI